MLKVHYRKELNILLISIILFFQIITVASLISMQLTNEDSQKNDSMVHLTNRLMGNKLKSDSTDTSPSSENSPLEQLSEEDNSEESTLNNNPEFLNLDQFSLKQRTGYSSPNMSNNIISTPIYIINNANFTNTASLKGWSGTGTNFDPIIIENYNISSSTAPYLFQMWNVSLFFIIQNCYFDAYENNTLFYNVTNGLVIGNTFVNATTGNYGLFMDATSFDNTIKYNVFENNVTSLGTNIYSANITANFFLYNYYDDLSSGLDDSPTDGVYDFSYDFIYPNGNSDPSPRVYKQFWNHKMINTTNVQSFASQEGFLGNGSQTNPFIISDLNITVLGNVNTLIALAFNNYHVRFDNCYLKSNNNTAIGIALGTSTLSASNVTINQTTICNLGSAIVIANAATSYNNITFTEVYNCTNAIEFYRGNYNFIGFNHFYNLTQGIYIWNYVQTTYNLFLNNTIENVKNGHAVNLLGGSYNQLINNTIANTTHAGIYITGSTQHIWFEKNKFFNCSNVGFSAFVGDVINATILENIFLNNSGSHSIRIMSGDANIIGNHINNSNSNGITIESGACNISKNMLHNNLDGIYLSSGADRTHIWDNIISNSRSYGIEYSSPIPSSADYVIIENNTIFGSANHGISITANHTWVTRNTVYSNTIGISISEGENNTLFLNDIYDNSIQQILDNTPNPDVNFCSYLFLGNYYSSNYTGTDLNGDNVGETQYVVAGTANNVDDWPLTVSNQYFQNVTFINGTWNGPGGIVIRSNEYITIEGYFNVDNNTDLHFYNVTLRSLCSSNGSNNLTISSGSSFSGYNSIITSANISNRFYIQANGGSGFYLEDTLISYTGHSTPNPGIYILTNDVFILRSNFTNNYIGLRSYSCSNLTLQKCTIKNSQDYGLYILDTQDILINKSILDSNSGSFIHSNVATNCNFLNNTINKEKRPTYALEIHIAGCHISNNVFTQFDGTSALYLEYSSVDSNVTGNQFYDLDASAILLDSDNCSVINNIIENITGTGIFLEGDYSTVTGNTINDTSGTGISSSSGGYGHHANITGNSISYVSNGITLRSTYCIVSDNVLTNNNLGLNLQPNAPNCTINNNTICFSQSFGALIYASNTIISQNSVYSNNGEGIRLDIDAENNTIYLNDVLNNVIDQISDTSGNTNHFSYQYLGNYYGSDYTGVDLNGDMVGESPYAIGTGSDDWPLTKSIQYFQNMTFINGPWTGPGGVVIRSNEYITIEGDFAVDNNTDLRFYNVTLRFVCSSNGSNDFVISSGSAFTGYDSLLTSANISKRFFLVANSGSLFYLEGTLISYAGNSPTNRGVVINTDNVILMRSNFTNCYNGIYAAGSCSNLNIQQCVINNSINHGIFLSGASNVTISNTSITDNGDDGIYSSWVYNVSILQTNCSGNLGTGARFMQSTLVTLDHVMSSFNNYGIRFIDSPNCTLDNSRIWNNTFQNVWNWYSASSFPGHYIKIINTQIFNCSGNGVWLQNINESVVKNCTIYNNDNGIVISGLSGTYSNNIISLNRIYFNTGTGILLTNFADNNTFFLNDVLNNTIAQISDTTGEINFFSYQYLGNYYGSDYTGVDLNGDMVGESPYAIGTGSDDWPLTKSIQYFQNMTFINGPWLGTGGIEIRSNEYIILQGDFDIDSGSVFRFYNVTLRFMCSSNGSNIFFINSGCTFYGYNSIITSGNISNRFYLEADSGSIFYLEDTWISYAGDTNARPGVYINTDNVLLLRTNFTNNYWGIRAILCFNLTLQQCIIKNSESWGLYIEDSYLLMINKSTLDNNYGNCITSTLGDINCTFINNTLINNRGSSPVLQIGGSDCRISNNVFRDNIGNMGLYITSAAVATNITGNQFYNHSSYAIYIQSSNCSVFKNIIQDANGNGIYIEGNYTNVVGNSINNTYALGGIRVSSFYIGHHTNITGNNVSFTNSALDINGPYTIISGNILNNNSFGIYLDSNAFDSKIKNNTICFSQYEGIHINTNNTIITRNRIYLNNQDGIYLQLSVENNTIFLNDIFTNFGQITDASFSNNFFSYQYLGNYYGSDYTGLDLNGDMVGETTHSVGTGTDNWPLTKPIRYFENNTFINGSWVGVGSLEVRGNEYITIEGVFNLNSGTDLRLNNVTIRFVCSSNGSNFFRISSGHSFSAYNSIITSANVSNRFFLNANGGSSFYLEDTWISYAGHNSSFQGVYVSTDNVTFINSNFTNNYYGIRAFSCSNITLQNCIIKNSISLGLAFLGTENVIINGTTLDRNNENQISNTGGPLNCSFTNNMIINNLGPYTLIIDGNESQIINNIFRNNLGVNTLRLQSNSVGCNVSGNEFYDNAGNAIHILSNNCNLISNTIQNSSLNGIYNEGNYTVVEDCTINNSQRSGINLVLCYNVSIVQTNTSNNVVYGVECQQSTLITLDYLRSSFNDRGIMIQDSSNCSITNAVIWNNTDHNIFCYSSGALPTQYITISNSTIFNATNYGIYFSFTNESIIKNCTIYSNSIGISIEGISGYFTNNDVIGNNVTQNSFSGVLVDSADNNSFFSNNFSSNGVVSGTDLGIQIQAGEFNRIYNNSFLTGTALDDETIGFNQWDNTTYGNYWFNYNAFDYDGNNFGDTPYIITGSANAVDNFPTGRFQSFTIFIIDPTNTTFTSIPINITISASQYVNFCWYQIYQGGAWSNINNSLTYNNSFWTGLISLSSGFYGIRVYINDTLGNENTTASVYFTLSNIFLTITLTTPNNGSILQSTIQIDVLFIGSNGSFIYNWDAGTTMANTTLMVGILISLPTSEGFHTLEIYARDNSFNWSKAYYEFWVDDTEPTIDYYVSDIINAGNDSFVPFAINDTNQDNYWYTIDGGSPIYPTESGLIAPSITGNYQIVVFANDSAGNQLNITFTLYVQQAVTITLNYPTGSDVISSWCNISWSCTEELEYRIYYSPNNGSSWTVLADNVLNTSYLWDTTQVNDGVDYLVRIMSITTGQPGAVLLNDTFTIRNHIQQLVPPGSYTYDFQDVSIDITISGSTNITIERLSTLPSGIELNESYIGFGLYINITLSNPDALAYMNISFSYADLENDSDFDLDELTVYFFNGSSGQWEEATEIYYDIDNKLIIGYFNHTTVIGVLGRSQSYNPLAGLEFLVIILFVCIVFAVAIGGLYIIRNRKEPSKPELSTEEKLKEAFEVQKEKKPTESHLDLSALEFDLPDDQKDDT